MLRPPRIARGPYHLCRSPEVTAKPLPFVLQVRVWAGLHEEKLRQGPDDLVALAGVAKYTLPRPRDRGCRSTELHAPSSRVYGAETGQRHIARLRISRVSVQGMDVVQI